MTTFYTSDLHLGHTNIIGLSGRPFRDAEHMNQTLIENWNRVVQPDDTVMILGDLCMGRKDETIPLIKQLLGHKYLVVGNHDPMHVAYDKREWKREAWTARYAAAGIEGFYHDGTFERDVFTKDLVRTHHFPYTGDSTPGDERYKEYRPINFGHTLLHGHVHEAWKVKVGTEYDPFVLMINVGVDVWGFTPVSEHALSLIMDAHVNRQEFAPWMVNPGIDPTL